MAQCTATYEAGSNGSTITTGAGEASATAWNSTFIFSGNTATYDSGKAAHGSLSGKYDNSASGAASCTTNWTTALGTVTDHYGRLYIYMAALPAAHFRLQTFIGATGECAQIRILSTGKVQFCRPDLNWNLDGTVNVSTAQWIRIEWHIIHSATVGQVEFKLFNTADSTSANDTKTSAANLNTRASCNEVDVGHYGGGSVAAVWLDDVVVGATSYPGPAVVAATRRINLNRRLPRTAVSVPAPGAGYR